MEDSSFAPTVQPTSELADLAVDSMVVTLVPDLNVRSEPRLSGKSRGTVPSGEVAFVVDGPVKLDGHPWYLLASDSPCADPDDPRFPCQFWMGWVAGASEGGSPWIRPEPEACPPGRLDVSLYLSSTGLRRLSCFGDASWTLRAYIAPSAGGRGGTSIFSTEPGWLDTWGSIAFPQPEQTKFDNSSELAMHVHPDLGCSFGGGTPGCPFEALAGQWVIIQGHLDDPAAATCRPIYNPLWVDSVEEPLPPLPDLAEVVLRCRATFVATDVQPAP